MREGVCLTLLAAILILSSALPRQADGHGGRGGVSFRGSIWVGPGWWGAWGYPYYAEPPVVSERQVYVQPNRQQDEADYWYFCT